jgi:hypothetical protein
VSATAAVGFRPSTKALTVYVSGGDGDLFALDAATGAIDWQSVIATPSTTQNDYYDWSSPTLLNGKVYVGVSSQCDEPLVPNSGLYEYNASTGALVKQYFTMPSGEIGGSIWSSAAADSTGVYVDSGNNYPGTAPGDSSSMVSLKLGSLVKTGAWAIPPSQQVEDNDWAASPTLFTTTINGSPMELVTACNKNGYLYAMNVQSVSAGPVWSFDVGAGTDNGVQSCLGAAIFDGQHLFEPGNSTTINGTQYAGSLRELDPATGQPIWQTGLPVIVLGSPSLDAGGVIAAPTYGNSGTNGVYLLNASNGAVIKLLGIGKEFAQPVFADNVLILATAGGGLNVYGV